MKLVAIGKTKIKAERKDGEVKTYNIKSEAMEYLKENFQVGDPIKVSKWEKGVIVKVTKYSNPKGNYSSYGNKGVASDERSVLSSVCELLAGTDGITVKNVTSKLKEVFAVGMKLVKVENKTTTEEDEFGEGKTEDEFGGGNEEPQE